MINRKSTQTALAFGTALALAAAPQGGVTAQSSTGTAMAITAKEKQQGAEYHPQLVAEFGGAMTGPQALYVESIGKKVAMQSGVSNNSSDFTVTLLNSSVDNAFATTGGYIYTTRQLVTLMNNEAELAGVLGHENGHGVARHSANSASLFISVTSCRVV
jgi:predicted Zn-dependent protease